MSKLRVTAFLALLTLLLCLPLWAEQWEGNAARIRPGEFTVPGLFAASNSFPEGTRVQISSSRTGKSVEVTVTRRVDGTTGVFLLLSDQAAEALGLAAGDVERVVAAPVPVIPVRSYTPSETRKDLDDPRAGLETLREELKAEEAQRAAQAPVPAPQPQPVAPQPAPQPAVEPGPALAEAVAREPQKELFQPPQEAAVPTPAATQPAVAQAAAEPAADLGDYVKRDPQKQLFLPPREEEIAVTTNPPRPRVAQVPLQEPAPPAAAEVAAAETGPEVSDGPPRIAEAPLAEPPLASPEPPVEVAPAAAVEEGPIASAEVPQPVVSPPAAAPVEEPPFPLTSDEPITPPASTAPPAPVVALAGAPQPEAPPERPAAEARPPEAPAAAEPARVAAMAPGGRTYFIQLGAFTDEASAREIERRFQATYPVDVQSGARNGRSYFRVVIGPLGRDETGSVLLRFQGLGYRDAFVRAVN